MFIGYIFIYEANYRFEICFDENSFFNLFRKILLNQYQLVFFFQMIVYKQYRRILSVTKR